MDIVDTLPDRLEATACRDDASLRTFLESRISVNAWPIHSRPLRRLIRRRGLDVAAAHRFELPLDGLARLMRRIYRASRRVERALGIDNAFHNTLHNFDVALRLLLLEWPADRPIPEHLRRRSDQAYLTFEAIEPVVMDLARELLDAGIPAWQLARDLLAASGHDYGHTGGANRLGKDGAPTPLTHEETAEKHVAKFGIDLGMPPALILESLAAIRATTVHLRPGRARIQAATEFEKRMTLADVAGCVKRPDLWMTRVAIPILHEQIGLWKRRLKELPAELDDLRQAAETAPDDERPQLLDRLAALEAEHQTIIKTVSEAFGAELDFLHFVRTQRLQPLPCGVRLWATRIDRRIGLIERLLARQELLAPLDAQGFALLEAMTRKLANAESLKRSLASGDVHPNLRQLYAEITP